MATQGQRQQNFVWKSHMRDSVNLTRFDSEVDLWVRAYKNANRPKASFIGTMSTISLILQLIAHLLLLVVLISTETIKWIRKQ